MCESRRHLLNEYTPPEWAKCLNNIPKYFVKLAHRHTPINEWKLKGIPDGFKVGIKRDDMTGSTLGGSKVRKLEFILADAIQQNCDAVVTMGSQWSNHCRSTAIAAKQLGLKCHLFVYCEDWNEPSRSCQGNRMLMKLTSNDVTLTERSDNEKMYEKMEEFSKLRMNGAVSRTYIIAGGGSSYQGLFGYITCFEELIQQKVLEDYTDLFVTSGSTGTAAALAIANHLTGSRIKIHAVTVSREKKEVLFLIQQEIDTAGLRNVHSEDIIDVLTGYYDRGYGISTKEELDDILDIAQTTGVILDPVYTIKTTRRMLVEMRNNPSRFNGKKVLFLHTGGIFNLFTGSLASYFNHRQDHSVHFTENKTKYL